MKLRKLIPFAIIFALSIFLRSINLLDRAPFDWDQNRDYSQVLAISQGEYLPLGPVAKGSVGGFFLGSLYYYILLPAFSLLSGALIALPVTSIFIDSLVAGLIYLLFSKSIGKKLSLLTALTWAISWFLVESSRISWNVALIPIWSAFAIYFLDRLRNTHSKKALFALALLGGISFHIHVSVIGVFFLLMLFSLRYLRFPLRVYIQAFLFGLLPLIPLIHYDLTHAYKNLRLVRDYISTRPPASTSLIEMLTVTLTKIGKVTKALYFANFADSLFLGIIMLILAFINFFRAHSLIKVSSLIIILNTTLIILLRDYNFPEYYLALSYLPLLLVGFYSLLSILKLTKNLSLPLTLIILIYLSVINYQSSSTARTAYSLGAKQELVESLTSYDMPLDIHLQFDPGREGGFEYLIARSEIRLDSTSSMQILLTDRLDSPGYIDGELCEDLTHLGNIKSAFHIVQ
jgi:hypothetical protein